MADEGDLLTAVGDRIRAFLVKRNTGAVTSDSALADVRAVRQAIEEDRFDRAGTLRAKYLVAVLHWSRYAVLPPGRRELEYLTAKHFFEEIAPFSPERVPPLLRPVVLPSPAVGETGDPADADERLAALTELGAALIVRYQHQGNPADAEEAVRACRSAVALARATGDPQTPVLVANLGAALVLQNPTDLAGVDEAIAMIDRELPGADVRGSGHLLAKLAVALDHRFVLTRDHRDLNRAAQVARRRADLLPAAGASRAEALARLAMLLGNLFEATGAPAELTAAVTAARDAVTARHPDRLRWAGHLSNLAHLLRIRYEHYRSRADLDEAIALETRALEAAPDHPKAVALWSNHSASLRERFRQARNGADLNAAVDAGRRGLDGGFHVPCAVHLGCALLDRHLHTKSPDDLDEAVATLQQAAASLEPGHRFFGPASVNLGIAMHVRFESTGDLNDLDVAVRANRAGYAASLPDDPARAQDAIGLAQSLRTRFETTGDVDDASAAIVLFREAAESAVAPAQVRLDAARAWTRLAPGPASRRICMPAVPVRSGRTGWLLICCPWSPGRACRRPSGRVC
ncbi:tetratricopeptide repeat protein [Actinoplanes sp. RD1]|uniref:hypothetical protein n=1 Tax=Actinoplanes sp. RD1 TaxID=3064538 RepID=UPI0027419BC7|nr:hypothetical protein [Actinoplanes sp. RD1]